MVKLRGNTAVIASGYSKNLKRGDSRGTRLVSSWEADSSAVVTSEGTRE